MNIKIKKILLKKNKSKIVCLTSYSKVIAKILDNYCDLVLVGDSMANVLYGFKNTHKITSNVLSLLEEEEKMGLTSKETLFSFADRVSQNKTELLSLLNQLHSEGKKVVGISAPARSCTVLNYCKIDSSLLNYITESSSLKIGKYTPGTHIPIKSDSFLNDEQPDFALLLSWHLKDSIIPKLRQNGFKGKFIIPLPKPIIL